MLKMQLPEWPVFFSIENTDRGQYGSSTKNAIKFHLKDTKGNAMIEITLTDKARLELFKVIRHFDAKSIRLIQQGFG
jgi:hypothetical protein